MKKIILFLITITTFTNVSYASFPVVEKVSDLATGTMTDPGLSSYFPYYANIWVYIWGIGVFIPLFFFYKNLPTIYQRNECLRQTFRSLLCQKFK